MPDHLPHNPVAAQPPDKAERSRALDPAQSFLVQAPAGSGKTHLLTQRFLRLLSLANKPDEIVAITFTNAAAAEMRNRILDALEKADSALPEDADPESLPALAVLALRRARLLGWQLLELPGQLRITTIDAFCRGLALQSPLSWGLLSGLGGRLDPVDQPDALYLMAATRTLELLRGEDSSTRRSVETLLLWRDNNWKDVEDLLVKMLDGRNRWHQEFVFAQANHWEALRIRLESPFRRAALGRLETLGRLLDELPGSREYALELARFACLTPGKSSPLSLAERADLPTAFSAGDSADDPLILEDACEAYRDLAGFLLTGKGEWRKKGGLNVNNGFPATKDGKAAKERFGSFVEALAEQPGLLPALAAFLDPMPVRYTEDEWKLIRHCFAVLRHAAAQLQVVFAETGSVDFTEVAQIALRILVSDDHSPSDFAIKQADGIRHLLVDEFQDTSRNQHQLLARLIAAWPEREGRTCFCVGDPMQSIYGFREAEVELFERVKTIGLEIAADPPEEPFRFEFLQLRANFRTAPSLVNDLNVHFERIFAEDDGSGVRFSSAVAATNSPSEARTELHLAFTNKRKPDPDDPPDPGDPTLTRQTQLGEMIALIRSKLEIADRIQLESRESPEASRRKYRIAVLGRTRSALLPVAIALREAGIGFRAIDLVPLRERPEVLDALSLARALLNPTDRTAWLGVLRAPWCGLSLAELHCLTSADKIEISSTPVPSLLENRLPELFAQGEINSRAFLATSRVQRVLSNAVEGRATAVTVSLGTWLESVWKALGGGDTVDAGQRANLRLLWAALDGLPEGELDLLGPGLDAALEDLFALPDPAASSDFGVQLMTIHKSKGLEFEVVLVPDLEADSRKSDPSLISWLERGLPPSQLTEDGEVTEFLIAPIQAKGADAGAAKSWVDRVKREREHQEMRRLLYVAATRAREELHLFARPRYHIDSKGQTSLNASTGLLAMAWPAFGGEIEARFDAWLAGISAVADPRSFVSFELETLAAESAPVRGDLLQMPGAGRPSPATLPTILRRLPDGYLAPEFRRWGASSRAGRSSQADSENQGTPYERTEGGLRSRLLGTAIHSLLEQLSHLRRTLDPAEAAAVLADFLPSVTAAVQSRGLPRPTAEQLASEALAAARRASLHPIGSWILAPHPNAIAEARWTGLAGAGSKPRQIRNLRPDRVFLAPGIAALGLQGFPVPRDGDGPVWWIIDYKSSHTGGLDLADESARLAFLASHRGQYAGQLAAYAQLLRNLRGIDGEKTIDIRAGIFYPLLQILDFWPA